MKKIIWILLCITPFAAEAQLGGLINRAKNKIKDKIDNKVDKTIDKTLDKPEAKTTQPENKNTGTASEAGETASTRNPIAAYSKYDFIPGEKVIYAEDFASDNIGELPMNWNTRGKGELVTLENFPGKWLRLFPGTTYLTGNNKAFGENYTIEFDLIMDGTIPKGTRFFPSINFGMFASGNKKVIDNTLFVESEYLGKNVVTINAKPNADAISKMELRTKDNSGGSFDGEQEFAAYSSSFFKVAHYAIQVQKQRLRFWVNDHKVFDVPRAVNLSHPLNNLFFSIASYFPYNDNNYGLYVSNIKIASGLPDSRHKLLEEGKFSTTGILFDLNSATVKPESNSILREIAGVLKEHADVKVKVVGHTSNDGDDAANLELSKQRSAAIVQILVKEYGIESNRLQSEGKGETQPLGDNKTKEGRAQNRRVEFIKL